MLNSSFVCSKTPIVAVTYRKITEIRYLLHIYLHTFYVRNNVLRACLLCGLYEIAASLLGSHQISHELIKCDSVAM